MTTPVSVSASIPTLLLDTREHALATELTRIGVPFTVTPLDAGDFHIVLASTSTLTPPLLIAERKSFADFAASNTDGRYREQRARLMAAKATGVAVLYVLEGVWTPDEAGSWGRGKAVVTESTLRRLTTRLMLRYGLPVLGSDSVAGTARWIRTLLAQVTDDPKVFQPEEGVGVAAMAGFTAALTMNKKGNRTSVGTAHAMLAGIPGLGEKRIEALLGVASIAVLATKTIAEMAELVVAGKRIGPALATTIHDAMHAVVCVVG